MSTSVLVFIIVVLIVLGGGVDITGRVGKRQAQLKIKTALNGNTSGMLEALKMFFKKKNGRSNSSPAISSSCINVMKLTSICTNP